MASGFTVSTHRRMKLRVEWESDSTRMFIADFLSSLRRMRQKIPIPGQISSGSLSESSNVTSRKNFRFSEGVQP